MTGETSTQIPSTKAARQQLIGELLGREPVHSLGELVDLLVEHGVASTASTVSRDLSDLDAVKIRGADGTLVYAVPAEGGDRTPQPGDAGIGAAHRLHRIVRELLVSAEGSANLAVLRTPPGAAQYMASAIDHAGRPEVLGTIAGDDTVLLITRSADGGTALVRWFTSLAATPAAASVEEHR